MTRDEIIELIGARRGQFVVDETNADVVLLTADQFDRLLDAFMLVIRQRDEEANGRCELAGVIESYDAEVRKLLTQTDEKEG